MTVEELTEKMKAVIEKHSGDPEGRHAAADQLLCEALKELGYGAAVDLYEEVEKWYA